MNKDEETILISRLVEKVSKGVRKQLKGYVRNTIEEIENERKRNECIVNEFKLLGERFSLVRADFKAFESMLKEGVKIKKNSYEINKILEEVQNRMSDLMFLKIELSNELKILKKRNHS